MALQDVFYHGLWYGIVVSLMMTAMIVITFRINPEMWVHDAPPAIRNRYGAVSEKSRRQAKLVALPLFVLLFGVLGYSIFGLYQMAGSSPGFWMIAFSLFVTMQTFNVVDLLLIDWLVVATLKPKALMIPGTEDWPGYDDYGFYFQGFLKGFVGISIASLVIAAVAVLIEFLL
jgi:hypothetical protein